MPHQSARAADRRGNGRGTSRRRLRPLLLASCYAAIVVALALVAGSFLYEVAREVGLARTSTPAVAENQIFTPIETGADATSGDEDPAPGSGETSPDQPNRAASLPDAAAEEINILLLGTDEREDEPGPSRTDTMMLLTIDLEQQSVGMISLPRDLWVPIPGYDITTKINTAYVLGERRGYPGGGSQLAKDTVSSFVGRPVDYYMLVNFNGFVRFIDQIGGVSVFIPETIHDEQYPTAAYGYQTFHLEQGRQHLDGQTALKYVRTRNIDSDYKRAERQQQLLQAILEQVVQADMIPTLVGKAPQLMATMRDSFSTDVSVAVAIELAKYVRQNPVQDVRHLVLDDRYGTETVTDDGAWILLPDRSRIRPALHQFFDTTVESITEDSQSSEAGSTADSEPDSGRQVSSMEALRLEVLNGSGYPGMAARLRDQLQAEGWHVASIGDADRSDYRRTLIVNYNADQNLVQQIGSDLQLSSSLPALHGLTPSDSIDLRIVVGQDLVKSVQDLSSD